MPFTFSYTALNQQNPQSLTSFNLCALLCFIDILPDCALRLDGKACPRPQTAHLTRIVVLHADIPCSTCYPLGTKRTRITDRGETSRKAASNHVAYAHASARNWHDDVCAHNFTALSLLVFYLCWFKKEKKMMDKLPIIALYIYDAMYHAHPYILSTTILSDN